MTSTTSTGSRMSGSSNNNDDDNDHHGLPQKLYHSMAWDSSHPSALLVLTSSKKNEPTTNDGSTTTTTTTTTTINTDVVPYYDNDRNTNETGGTDDTFQFHTLYSDPGSVNGMISSYEFTALLHLISTYETRKQQQQQQGEQLLSMSSSQSFRVAVRQYREIITNLFQNCKLNVSHDDDDDDPNLVLQPHEEQMLLLHQMSSILFLSEIYLLPPIFQHHHQQQQQYNNFYYYTNSDGSLRNWLDCPGIATSDTIRFLRLYYYNRLVVVHPISKQQQPSSTTTTTTRMDDDNNSNMKKKKNRHQPPPQMDEYPNDNNAMMVLQNDDDDDDYNMEADGDEDDRVETYHDFDNEESYWDQILSYTKYGYLHLVWKLLQTHPWYVTAVVMDGNLFPQQQYDNNYFDNNVDDTNTYIVRTTTQSILQDWEQIGSVLLTAPIPGGPCQKPHGSNAINDDNDVVLSDYDLDLSNVDGLNVSCTDYQCWDMPSIENDPTTTNANKNDIPMVYIPEIAIQKHQLWIDYAKHVRSSNRLCRKLLHIDQLMQLLCGDFTLRDNNYSKNSNDDSDGCLFTSWSEQLSCELLYRTPHLRPRFIATRTSALIKEYHPVTTKQNNTFMNQNDQTTTNEPPQKEEEDLSISYEMSMVAIMQGNVGQAMKEIYDLGGGSGAAIPMTLMALMFDMFIESGIVPKESIEQRNEFFTEAASSIVSSLRVSHTDLGVQLAIRLLLPLYSTKSHGGEIAAATISVILEHYTPSTIQYARTVISLCHPLLSKAVPPKIENFNNIQQRRRRMLLDGCVSVIIQLHTRYERQQGRNTYTMEMMQLLLEGLDLESDVLPQPWLGTCYRVLDVACHSTALTLLQAMATKSSDIYEQVKQEMKLLDPPCIARAEAMSKSIERYISTTAGGKAIEKHTANPSTPTDRLPYSARLVINVVEMFTLFLTGRDHREQANHVIVLLSNSNIATSLLPVILKWWILRVARSLTERNIDDLFDKSGVATLLRHIPECTAFSVIAKTLKNNVDTDANVFESELLDMKSCFQELLIKTTSTPNTMKHKSLTYKRHGIESWSRRETYSNDGLEANKKFGISVMLD